MTVTITTTCDQITVLRQEDRSIQFLVLCAIGWTAGARNVLNAQANSPHLRPKCPRKTDRQTDRHSRWHEKRVGCLGWGITMSGEVQLDIVPRVLYPEESGCRVCSSHVGRWPPCRQLPAFGGHPGWWILMGCEKLRGFFCAIWVQSFSISFFIRAQTGHKNMFSTKRRKETKRDREKTIIVSQNRSLAALQQQLAAVH